MLQHVLERHTQQQKSIVHSESAEVAGGGREGEREGGRERGREGARVREREGGAEPQHFPAAYKLTQFPLDVGGREGGREGGRGGRGGREKEGGRERELTSHTWTHLEWLLKTEFDQRPKVT